MSLARAPDRCARGTLGDVEAGGLRIRLHVTPRASSSRILGLRSDADGATVLKVAVTAPAEGGKANAAVIAMLARAWHMPKTSLDIASGKGDRRKILRVSGEPAALAARLAGWAADHRSATGT